MCTKSETIISEMDVLSTQIEARKNASNKQILEQISNKNHSLKSISITECHVISSIASEEPMNGIGISNKTGLTRGAISKITTSLIKKGLITSYQDGINKKKIFYKLTPLGEIVNQIHSEEHQKINRAIINEVDKYTEQEQEVILKFIQNLQDFFNKR